jgi:hypothetical protein
MVNITLFEVHLDDSTLTANAPFSAESGEAAAVEDDETESEDGGSGGPLVALVGFVFLVVVGVALRRFLRGDEDATDEVGEADPVTEVDIEA